MELMDEIYEGQHDKGTLSFLFCDYLFPCEIIPRFVVLPAGSDHKL